MEECPERDFLRHMVYNSNMSNERLNSILRDIYRTAKDIFGEKLEDVILYGSFARGDEGSESDIDIMILANIEQESAKQYREAINEMAWEIGMKHDILVSVSVSGNTYFHDWKNDLPFYRNVWNEGRRLSA
ncbi:hypothetical protein AGMMS49983_11080 [Clostridia bacterium]|nr:hypothetical protein AGMMS49983_11080 [Clostridia bacterium]